MKTYTKEVIVYGDKVIAQVILSGKNEELVRLLVIGSWYGPQDTSKAPENMMVEKYPDGSFTITMQKLIPLSMAENEKLLDEETDKVLNSIEDALGLDQESLSTSSNNVGHWDTTWDFLMTKEEQDIVLSSKSGRITAPASPCHVGPICCECQYCGDKHSFPMPNDLLEVYPENPLLKVLYCCCGDCDLYGKEVTKLGLTECKCFEEL